MSALRMLVFAVFSLMTTTSAVAQVANEFRLSVLQGDAQTAVVGQVFPQQLAVLLTDLNGVPLPDARISFSDIGCISITGIPCELPGAPGRFEDGSEHATAMTDSAGIAIAPYLTAGQEAGAIGLFANVIPYERPYFYPGWYVVTHSVAFRLNQVAVPTSIPTLSFWFQCLLAGLLTLVCGVVFRQIQAARYRSQSK